MHCYGSQALSKRLIAAQGAARHEDGTCNVDPATGMPSLCGCHGMETKEAG